jgi:hypothetical protein
VHTILVDLRTINLVFADKFCIDFVLNCADKILQAILLLIFHKV